MAAGERRHGMFTLQYAPPELIQPPPGHGSPSASAAVDMWALGAMLQEVLSAPSQMGSCFMPDKGHLLELAAADRPAAIRALVAAQQEAWVS